MQNQNLLANIILAIGVISIIGVGWIAMQRYIPSSNDSGNSIWSLPFQNNQEKTWVPGRWATNIPNYQVVLDSGTENYAITLITGNTALDNRLSAGRFMYDPQTRELSLDPQQGAMQDRAPETKILTMRKFSIRVDFDGPQMIWTPTAAAHRTDLMHPLFHLNGTQNPVIWTREARDAGTP